MNEQKIIWIPRIITMLFILFISMFAFDCFSGTTSMSHKMVLFAMHMIPSIVLFAVLLLSWKYPAIAGGIILGIAVVFTFWYHTYTHTAYFLIISLPPVLIGAMFIAIPMYFRKKEEKTL